MSINSENNHASIQGLSETDRKTLRKAIMEINDSMTRVDSERDLQKEIIAEIHDKLAVDKKLLRRMAKAYYKSSFNNEVEENNSFEQFYDTIIHKTAL
jgi:ABC-type microcin C transport system permease subunit YejB